MKIQQSSMKEYKGYGEKTTSHYRKPSYTILHGAHSNTMKVSREDDSLLDNLKQVTTLSSVGDPVQGFDRTKLGDYFAKAKSTQLGMNIIFFMHGVVPSRYMLITKSAAKGKNIDDAAETDASEVITELVKATHHVPINLFILSCYGANLQQFLPLLPRGSIMITLSDSDKPSSGYDLSNKNMQAMYKELPQKFSILDLLQIYCISQTYTCNTPIVGFFDKAGRATSVKLSHFVPKIVELREEPSPFLAKLFVLNGITNAHLDNLYARLNHKNTIDGLKPPKNLILEIINNIADDLNKIFARTGIDDPSVKCQFISTSNMFLDNGFKSAHYNEDITKLLSLGGGPLEALKQQWAQKYYFHQHTVQKLTFKVSDFRKLVELFFGHNASSLVLKSSASLADQDRQRHEDTILQFVSNLEEDEGVFPIVFNTVRSVPEDSEYDYRQSPLPSYSLMMAKSVDAAKRYIHIETQSVESLLLPYPCDFDITGKLPSSDDNPCFAPRDLSGVCEEY